MCFVHCILSIILMIIELDNTNNRILFNCDCKNTVIKVKVASEASNLVKIISGLRQRDTLSFIIINLMLDKVVGETKTNVVIPSVKKFE